MKKSIFQVTKSLNEWINHLESLHHTASIRSDLELVRHIATNLNLLQPAPLVITVGGTNGKGTTCRLLENILMACGMRVGIYSSPHLVSYTERVRIQGNEVSENIYIKAMMVIETSRDTIPLSYFEFSTLVALYLFHQVDLDVVILEVGIGGRLDATNIIDTDIAVITSIDVDHNEYLGSNRSSIAKEKAGIFRFNRPAVIGEPNRPIILDKIATNCGALLYATCRDWWWQNNNNHWYWWNSTKKFIKLPLPSIPLENAATALATICCLPFVVSEEAIHQGLRNVILPGRFQCINQSPLIILDVAHNPHAANYLARRLTKLTYTGQLRAIVGMLTDKDIFSTLSCLRHQVDIWYCVSLSGPRAASAAQLAAYLEGNNVRQFKDVLSAWYQVISDATPEDCILIFGSFYTVAPILSLTQKIL